jgi:hypothetical protein
MDQDNLIAEPTRLTIPRSITMTKAVVDNQMTSSTSLAGSTRYSLLKALEAPRNHDRPFNDSTVDIKLIPVP